MGQRAPMLQEHLSGKFVPRLKPHLLGHAGRATTLAVFGPFLGQIQTYVHQAPLLGRNVAQVDADLTVLHLAQTAAPLPRHTHRVFALLGKRRRIQDQYAVGAAEFPAHFLRQLPEQGPVVPRRGAEEVLQVLAILVVLVGDHLRALPSQIREQPLDVRAGVLPLLRLQQMLRKGAEEAAQPRQHPLQEPCVQVTLVQNLLLPYLKTSFHRRDSYYGSPPEVPSTQIVTIDQDQ
jgi:hypothetical protein